MTVSFDNLESKGFVKDKIFFNLLECMNVEITEKDKLLIKRDCLN